VGNAAGVRRDFDELERRRMAVAREVGVHRQSVSRWAKELKASGVRGLRKAGRIGRPPKLTRAQLGDLARTLQRGPEALGYASGLWTVARVRNLIERRTGVRYHAPRLAHPAQAGVALPAAPSGGRWSAMSRRLRAGRRWSGRGLKKACAKRRTILFVGESGLSERPHRVRT
jgi:hypothetical protein